MKQKYKGLTSVIDFVSTTDGTRELWDIFGEEVYVFPKPVELIKEFVRQATDEDSWVLDSFAGSAPTAQAVLELNEEDGGHRKFVLVQLAHETQEQIDSKYNICEKVTRERAKRVIDGYKSEGNTVGCIAGRESHVA